MTAPVMPAWEAAARAELKANACGTCGAEGLNHYAGFPCVDVADPGREHCPDGCGYPKGTLGARMAHRKAAAA